MLTVRNKCRISGSHSIGC